MLYHLTYKRIYDLYDEHAETTIGDRPSVAFIKGLNAGLITYAYLEFDDKDINVINILCSYIALINMSSMNHNAAIGIMRDCYIALDEYKANL